MLEEREGKERKKRKKKKKKGDERKEWKISGAEVKFWRNRSACHCETSIISGCVIVGCTLGSQFGAPLNGTKSSFTPFRRVSEASCYRSIHARHSTRTDRDGEKPAVRKREGRPGERRDKAEFKARSGTLSRTNRTATSRRSSQIYRVLINIGGHFSRIDSTRQNNGTRCRGLSNEPRSPFRSLYTTPRRVAQPTLAAALADQTSSRSAKISIANRLELTKNR